MGLKCLNTPGRFDLPESVFAHPIDQGDFDDARYEQAENDIKDGVKLNEKMGFAYDKEQIELWKLYSELLMHNGKFAEATEMEARASAMQKAYDEQ